MRTVPSTEVLRAFQAHSFAVTLLTLVALS